MAQTKQPVIDVKVHRRVLRFLNAARRPEDLMVPPQKEIPLIDERVMFGHEGAMHADEHREEEVKGKHLLDRELAKRVFEEREKISPLYGFQHIKQLLAIKAFDRPLWERFFPFFSNSVRGQWEVLYDSGTTVGTTPISVIHAALLRTGSVLFIANAYSPNTLIWDPEDPDPLTAFRVLDGATTGLGTNRLACAGHSFLSDGKLLAVGGDGPSLSDTSNKGWKFDPDPAAETWTQTAGDMATNRWYPTTVTLGDDSGRVLVVNGALSNSPTAVSEVEIYSESSDSFSRVWGPTGPGDLDADRAFPKLYPGLHLLPNGQVFHTRVGDRSGTDKTASFTFSAYDRGEWTELTDDTTDFDRPEGMSVLLLRQQPADPDRVLVVGGGNTATQQTIGVVEIPATPTSVWLTGTFPDALPREGVNVVLLPDGKAFICGGRPTSGMPSNGGACMLYTPPAGAGLGTLAEMDTLQYSRKHHSVALLLPSGKVMVTGGSSNTIEVFSPPYLFDGMGNPIPESSRPDITSFPDPEASPSQIVLHGSTFEIGTSNPADIEQVVLVRPMAVTHQTDTEQRVLRLAPPTVTGTTTISVTAPGGWVYPYGAGGGHTHAIAGRGYYMLFILNTAGVPSKAKFIRLV